MDKIAHEMRITQWTYLISKCNNSGMSKKALISANNNDEKQFNYWQRCVREEVFQELQPSFPSAASFVELPPPVSDVPQGGQPDAVPRIGNCALEIRNTISPVLLQTIVQVMAHA